MKASWRAHLDQAGAEFDGDYVAHFGNPQQEYPLVLTGNVFADLSHLGLVAVHGKDAAEFMQGQFTNDIRLVDAGNSQLSAWCSPKGRVLFLFRVFRKDDTWYLQLPTERVEALIQRLRMYVLMAKVTVEDATDSWVRIGCTGPDAAREMEDAVQDFPTEVDGVVQHGGLTIIRLPGVQPCFEVIGDGDEIRRFQEQLDVRCAGVGRGPWELLEVLAGVPEVVDETGDAFVPQMLNLQVLGGVNFKKGCYTGQEVVARMQYLGKLKRRMYLARVETEHAPLPGQGLWAATMEGAQGAGKIVRGARWPDGGYKVLAVVRIEDHDGGEVRLGDQHGPVLQFEDLPYSLESTE